MSALINLVGQKFGRLIVLARAGSRRSDKYSEPIWECRCDCGETRVVQGRDLRTGHTKSCGCLHKELSSECNTKHRMRYHELYQVWRGMIQRRHNPNHAAFPRYGGRGIKVCKRWRADVRNFIEGVEKEIGPCPPGLELDRIGNDGHYEPGNLRWATSRQQKNNRRNSKKYPGVQQAPSGRWEARIEVNSENCYLGTFLHEQIAAAYYRKAARTTDGRI